MRIGGTQGIEPQGQPTRKGESGKPVGAEGSGKSKGSTQSLEIRPTLQPLVRRAAAEDEVNVAAVEAARKALQAGELDTPEAARRAAQAILDLGL